MNTIKQVLPQPIPAETIAAFTYSLSRQEALYGRESLNVERVIARMAQAIQKAIDDEVARLAEANGTDKLEAKIASLQRELTAMSDKVAAANQEANQARCELRRCKDNVRRINGRGERTDLLETELSKMRDTAVKLTDKLNDARRTADALREENRRMANELESLARFRGKAERVFEHPALLPSAKAE